MTNMKLDFAMGIYILILIVSSIYFSYDYILNKNSISLIAFVIIYFWFGLCFYQYTKFNKQMEYIIQDKGEK